MTDARVVHRPADGSERVLATDVEIADSMLSRARGLMFRGSLPEEYALVLEVGGGLFGGSSVQTVHMLFVRLPLDVIWLAGGEVQRVARLRPWRDIAAARADRILELPAGAASGVEQGDSVAVENL